MRINQTHLNTNLISRFYNLLSLLSISSLFVIFSCSERYLEQIQLQSANDAPVFYWAQPDPANIQAIPACQGTQSLNMICKNALGVTIEDSYCLTHLNQSTIPQIINQSIVGSISIDANPTTGTPNYSTSQSDQFKNINTYFGFSYDYSASPNQLLINNASSVLSKDYDFSAFPYFRVKKISPDLLNITADSLVTKSCNAGENFNFESLLNYDDNNYSEKNQIFSTLNVQCDEDSIKSPNLKFAKATNSLCHLSFKQISSGVSHSCGVTYSGKVYCWGQGGSGQRGDGSNYFSSIPQLVLTDSDKNPPLTNVIQVSAGLNHTCAIKDDGSNPSELYCWGSNLYGQLGIGSTTNMNLATKLNNLSNVTQVTTGSYHTCAIRSDGSNSSELYCWGLNNSGQLGIGTSGTNMLTPVKLSINPEGEQKKFSEIVQIAAGNQHTCAILTNNNTKINELHCWGLANSGQLGIGLVTATPTPPAIKNLPQRVKTDNLNNLNNVTSIYIGAQSDHTCALSTNKNNTNDLYCWGHNDYKQLGYTTSSFPNEENLYAKLIIGNFSTPPEVSLGHQHTCILSDGKIICHGSNNEGSYIYNRLGCASPAENDDIEGTSPTCINNVNNLFSSYGIDQPSNSISLSSGKYNNCITVNGSANGASFCFGKSIEGQLGYGHYSSAPKLFSEAKLVK